MAKNEEVLNECFPKLGIEGEVGLGTEGGQVVAGLGGVK